MAELVDALDSKSSSARSVGSSPTRATRLKPPFGGFLLNQRDTNMTKFPKFIDMNDFQLAKLEPTAENAERLLSAMNENREFLGEFLEWVDGYTATEKTLTKHGGLDAYVMAKPVSRLTADMAAIKKAIEKKAGKPAAPAKKPAHKANRSARLVKKVEAKKAA